jgi:FkbM family methyltransferase
MAGNSSLIRALRNALRKFGLRVSYDRVVRDANRLFAAKARELGIKSVFDIGANVGQFAKELRANGYAGHIVSFEPTSAAHAKLTRIAADDSLWDIAPRVALGDRDGDAEINVSANSESSSLLTVLDRSVKAEAQSAFTGCEAVAVRRLDSIIRPEWNSPFGFKIDTQGYELHVLRGARESIKQSRLILVEMSLVDLYNHGVRFAELYKYLEDQGFRCIGLVDAFSDYAHNEMLQVDGIFIRSK